MQDSKDKIFLEDVAYGIYDRPGPMGRIADEEEDEETTVPSSVPVDPSPQMSNQLSVSRPPIEDEEYVPTSVAELSKAASAIAQLAPNDSIEYFYRQLHKLLDDTTDRAAEASMDDLEDGNQGLGDSLVLQDDEEDDAESSVKESVLRKVIRKKVLSAIKEARWDSPDPRWVEDEGYGIEEPEVDMSRDGMSLDDLAAEFGYSGAPGIRQEIDRLTDRLKYFATNVKKQDLEALLTYSVGEYIDALAGADLIDDQDAEDLRSSPKSVRELDSFRYFFVSAMVLPAYRQVVRTATKNVKKEIEDLGVPKTLHQTVFNQITGATSSKPEVIKKKLEKLVASEDLTPEEAKAMAKKIRSARQVLLAASNYSDDLVQISLDKWQSLGKSAKQKTVKQAMEKTLDER